MTLRWAGIISTEFHMDGWIKRADRQRPIVLIVSFFARRRCEKGNTIRRSPPRACLFLRLFNLY